MLFHFNIAVAAPLLCLATQILGVVASPIGSRSDKTITITIDTPLPAGVSEQAVLAILHDANKMIHLNPLVKKSSLTSAPGVEPAEYSITDTIFGVFPTTYLATFKNSATGMDTVVHAGVGITTTGHWEVSGKTLHEKCDVTGNSLLLPFVKSQIESSHKKLHDELIAMVKGSK